MSAILAANRGEGDYAWVQVNGHEAAVPSISVQEAPGWLDAHHAAVLDVREPAEYAAGHVPGAVSVPQADLALRLDELPSQRDVLVVCHSGARSLRSARFLKAVGYDRVTNLEGGTQAWMQAGHPVERADVAPVQPAT
jgi:rhodanese-related sulfurtransferase